MQMLVETSLRLVLERMGFSAKTTYTTGRCIASEPHLGQVTVAFTGTQPWQITALQPPQTYAGLARTWDAYRATAKRSELFLDGSCIGPPT